MPAKRSSTASANVSTATIGFEAKLWLNADKLRNNMDAAEPSRARQPARQGSPKGQRGGAEQYEHIVLVLIFLSRAERDRSRASVTRRQRRGLRVKYISDTFEEHRAGGRMKAEGRMMKATLPILTSSLSLLTSPRSGGMFVQSEKFVESHGGKLGDISIYGQYKWARRQRPFGLAKRARRVRLRGQQPKQSNATTRRLAVMNLALRGIEADFGPSTPTPSAATSIPTSAPRPNSKSTSPHEQKSSY